MPAKTRAAAASVAASESALASNGGSLPNLLVCSEFEAYRDEPRFIDFAAPAGFPIPIREARFGQRAAADVKR